MKKHNSISPLLPIGLLFMSATFVIGHFAAVPDLADGFLKGIGIGLILLALLLPKFRKMCW